MNIFRFHSALICPVSSLPMFPRKTFQGVWHHCQSPTRKVQSVTSGVQNQGRAFLTVQSKTSGQGHLGTLARVAKLAWILTPFERKTRAILLIRYTCGAPKQPEARSKATLGVPLCCCSEFVEFFLGMSMRAVAAGHFGKEYLHAISGWSWGSGLSPSLVACTR